MSHECIDWKAAPPRPKTPFITISYGGAKVLARRGAGTKVHEFKALQHFAHRGLFIQSHAPSSLRFRTSCNLGCTPIEHGSIFEVTEETWEEEGLRDLVGCLEVFLCEHEEVMPGPLEPSDEPPPRVEFAEPSCLSGGSDAEPSQSEDECVGDQAQVQAQVQVPDQREEAREREYVETSADVLELTSKSEILDQTLPVRRRVVVSDKKDEETPDRKLAADPVKQEALANASKKSLRDSIPHPPDLGHTSDAEWSVKKKEERLAHRLSAAESSNDSRVSGGRSQSTDMPIKQEPISAPRVMSQPKAGRSTQEAESTTEPPDPKLVISIQHKPSAQRAQFSTKSHTRVGKVLAGACKSFRLDVNVAQLYLVVVTQNDKGLKEENYFMCDRDETMENVMAGMDERAEFVILLLEDL